MEERIVAKEKKSAKELPVTDQKKWKAKSLKPISKRSRIRLHNIILIPI